MALFGTSADKQLEALRGLHGDRIRLADKISALEVELQKLRGDDGGERALDAFLAGAPATDAARAQAVEQELSDLRGARQALCKRIRAAILDLGKTRGAGLRKQARKLESELEKHLERLGELRRQLEEFSEARWCIQTLPDDAEVLMQPSGTPMTLYRTPPPFPKSSQLQAEISRLNSEAAAIEERARWNTEGGQAGATSLDELLAIAADPERLAPLPAALTAWFEQATARAAEEWEETAREYTRGADSRTGKPFTVVPQHAVDYVVYWDSNGEIDMARSSAKNRVLHASAVPATAA